MCESEKKPAYWQATPLHFQPRSRESPAATSWAAQLQEALKERRDALPRVGRCRVIMLSIYEAHNC